MKEIRLSGITKRFGETVAVSELNLEVERGEFVTLLGPSGCGKTTTLRLLAGFQPPSAGFIEIGGRVVSDVERNIFVPPAKRRIGMVFQDYALWPHMDVFANTVYPLKIAGVNRKERQDRVDQILTIVKMSGMQKRFPHELSGGQQQRVAWLGLLSPTRRYSCWMSRCQTWMPLYEMTCAWKLKACISVWG
jgi:iron(III) transport system ATP-binding protein